MPTKPINFIQNSAINAGNVSIVSPNAALKILQTQRKDVKKMAFIAPKLGDKSFGKFSVKWKHGAANAAR